MDGGSSTEQIMKPNSEETATKLYGNSVLNWESDLNTLRDVSSGNKRTVAINKNAVFQKRMVHDDYKLVSPVHFRKVKSPGKVVVPEFDKPVESPKTRRKTQKKVTIDDAKQPKASLPPISKPELLILKPNPPIITLTAPILNQKSPIVAQKPNPTTSSRQPLVTLPKFKTRVVIEEKPVKRPTATSEKEISMSLRSMKNVSTVLNDIDPEKMIPGRIGAHKTGYSLNELKGFATDLGIAVSGKSKKDLIDSIVGLRRERGLD